MDFEIEQRFAAPAQAVAEALLDEDYQASLHDVGPLKSRELLEQRREGSGRVVRRVRCVLGRDLGAAKKFLRGADPAWVEEAHWDPDGLRWQWRIHPEVAAELLSAEGEIVLHEKGDGTVRVVSGHVKVKVPIYGGRVEEVIVKELEDAYSDEAARLSDWLDTKS
ncbi:MAG: DUF2505 domain-containing protein [Actinomycetota bacterium]|nr:DUF2505 domain-containing protein [Actinomycetota bacterium]